MQRTFSIRWFSRARLEASREPWLSGQKDIFEPTFITPFNDTDYVALNDGCFKAETSG
jgi:hypothetical protein